LVEVPRLGSKRAVVVTVALPAPGLGTFAVPSLEVFSHLLLHDLLQDGFDAFSDAALDIVVG
jgi:hypothetical protein